MQALRLQLAQLRDELEKERQLQATHRLDNESSFRLDRPSRRPRNYEKTHLCPLQDCGKKYSSRIALRAHLRKKHDGRYLSFDESRT